MTIVSTHSRAEATAFFIFEIMTCHRLFQHTAAQRRLHYQTNLIHYVRIVSTHSRAEATAVSGVLDLCIDHSFNTQPRRGDCSVLNYHRYFYSCFNTQPRRGDCRIPNKAINASRSVSTHSRAEATAHLLPLGSTPLEVSTHSRAEATAVEPIGYLVELKVSTHSRAEATAPYIKKQEKSAD